MTAVKGCYPAKPRGLDPDKIDAEVLEVRPGVYVIRVDDRKHDDMWLQLTVRVGDAGPGGADAPGGT